MIGKAFKAVGHWIGKHGNFILLMLVLLQCVLALYSSFSGLYVEREYKKQQTINQMEIEKAKTEKEIAILEAEKDAELLRIKSGDGDLK